MAVNISRSIEKQVQVDREIAEILHQRQCSHSTFSSDRETTQIPQRQYSVAHRVKVLILPTPHVTSAVSKHADLTRDRLISESNQPY